MNRNVINVLLIGVGIFLFSQNAMALLNPSACYCTALGYTYIVKDSADGGETGYCVLPDNREVDAWDFLRGSEAQQYSGCIQQGYELKVVNDPTICESVFSDSCSVCVLKDGREVEVTQLMNLSFIEPQFKTGKPGDIPKSNVTIKDSTSSTATPAPGFGSLTAFISLGIVSFFVMQFLNQRRIKK